MEFFLTHLLAALSAHMLGETILRLVWKSNPACASVAGLAGGRNPLGPAIKPGRGGCCGRPAVVFPPR
jgi:hypothetical protein